MPHVAVTRLLQCLNNFHPQLPKTYHTLFPPLTLQYEPMNDGLYVHIPNWIPSLQDMLLCFSVTVSSDTSTYCLAVNKNDPSLFSSSPDCKSYPILITVHKIKMHPLCAGIYCTEPSSNREMLLTYVFLKKCLEDQNNHMTYPVVCNGREYCMKEYPIFVCDATARKL